MMKSRQRSSKRKQRFSDGWQSAVLKQQDSTTNSTALSPEITKLETVGQTPTKGLYHCGSYLTKDELAES